MARTRGIAFLALALVAPVVNAQQGVLVNGNSELPSCAQSCTALIQGAQACSATTAATQSSWICFCQSAFLTNLRSTAVGVCDSVCTNPTDNQQVSTWYNSNCGSDNGASEHPDTGSGTTTTSAAAGQSTATTTDAAAAATTSAGTSGDSGNSQADDGFGGGVSSQTCHDWWSCHYKWIIMLIVLAICLPLIAAVAVWLKRRHDRKQDRPPSAGFNAGITQHAPPMSNSTFNNSGVMAAAGPSGTVRSDSPARTREAFMPYGYGYARSASRNGSKQAVNEMDRRSPLARGHTPDMEQVVAPDAIPKKNPRRVLVREKSEETGESSSDGR